MKRRPIDGAWPALPLLTLAIAAIVAVLGIVAAPQPTDADRIADTVEDFAQAVQERRGADACALLTPAARQATAARTGTLSCAEFVRSFGFGFNAGTLRVARVVDVDIAGDRATIPAIGSSFPAASRSAAPSRSSASTAPGASRRPGSRRSLKRVMEA